MPKHEADPLETRPPSYAGQKLVEIFSAEPAQQAARYDDLAKELLKLLLALRGVYAVVLKLVADRGLVPASGGFLLNLGAFVFWFAAMLNAFRAVYPREYRNVMPDTPFRDEPPQRTEGSQPARPSAKTEVPKLTIEEFYREAARFKADRLRIAAILFFAGLLCAALSLFLYETRPNP